MTTMQDIITDARTMINDDGTRYSNATLLAFLNDGIAEAFTLRPDLAFPTFSTYVPLAIGDTFPLPVQHRSPLAHYVTWRAESINDESITSGRAVMGRQVFEQGITRT